MTLNVEDLFFIVRTCGKLVGLFKGCFPSMPNRLVRVSAKKVEQHFEIKTAQPKRLALATLSSFCKFPNCGKEPAWQKWNGEFRPEISGVSRIFWLEETDTDPPKGCFRLCQISRIFRSQFK